MKLRKNMLSTTVIPAAIALGVAGLVTISLAPLGTARANPCAAKSANPCAVKTPCAAKRACNPCAAKVGNPCGAANPCNPCAAGATVYSAHCVVPRLQTAAVNPCAAKNPCNPCGAKSRCNPCAAKKPCNPCAAKAVKAVKAANPCNPCAAKNPCNPCGAKNPCNPCGAAAAIELTDAESKAVYDCIKGEMKAAYAKSGLPVAQNYGGWKNYSRVAYTSATHGNRFVSNYANATGAKYGKFEDSGPMPVGTYLVKDSFVVSPDGKVAVGPLFIMRKMARGWQTESGDWKYAMVMPTGAFAGETKGRNSASMKFCYECHMSVAENQDSMFFLPEEYRVK